MNEWINKRQKYVNLVAYLILDIQIRSFVNEQSSNLILTIIQSKHECWVANLYIVFLIITWIYMNN